MLSHCFVFVVRCADGSLATGVAEDVLGKVDALNQGQGSSWFKPRLPVSLVYTEEYMNEQAAGLGAMAVKRLNRARKEELLAGWTGVSD